MTNGWAELSLYESVDVVLRAYEIRHDRELASRKATEITAHVAQGRQYMSSAADAGDLAKPLLVYYGVLSLTRAAILFLDVGKREAGLDGGHGLRAHEWRNDLGAGKDVRRLKLKVEPSGTFREFVSTNLSEAVVIYTGPFPSTTTLVQHHALPPDDSIIRVGELLSRLPAVLDLYEQSFDEFADIREGSVFSMSTQTDISIFQSARGLPPDDQLVSAFGLQGVETTHRREYFGREVRSSSGLAFRLGLNRSRGDQRAGDDLPCAAIRERLHAAVQRPAPRDVLRPRDARTLLPDDLAARPRPRARGRCRSGGPGGNRRRPGTVSAADRRRLEGAVSPAFVRVRRTGSQRPSPSPVDALPAPPCVLIGRHFATVGGSGALGGQRG